MIELSPDTFHRVMADNPMVACVLHHGAFESTAEKVLVGDASPFVWARIDLALAPFIGAMFGVTENQPYLLVMREEVVLFCQPLHSASPEDMRTTLSRAAQLDMSKVRRDVDRSNLGRDALFNRRACPTTWRRRAERQRD